MEFKLSFKKSSHRYDKMDLFNNIEKVWVHLQKQPSIKDMDCFPSEICLGTYFNHFGSWKTALIEFVKFKNNGEISETKYNPKPKEKRKDFNNSLRYDVMKRDSFKCRLCGKSPAIDQNVELEVDHIVPFSKGGKNSKDNLQTLCRECNTGKSNK